MLGHRSRQKRVVEKIVPRYEFDRTESLFHFVMPKFSRIVDVMLYKEGVPPCRFNLQVFEGDRVIFSEEVSSNVLESISLYLDGGIYSIKVATSVVDKCVVYYKI